MQGSYSMDWAYYENLVIGADFRCPPGGRLSNFIPGDNVSVDRMPIRNQHYFSIDVYTDDLVEIDIQVGMTSGTVATMVTLFCPAVLRHNTTYDLPAPFNRDGFLIVTGYFMNLQIRNVSGNVVSPFNLVAKVWK